MEESAVSFREYASQLREKKLPVIFTLGHLSTITSTSYRLLHDTVNRKRESANYTLFRIHKRRGGYRFIHAVNGDLLYIQKFINEEILQNVPLHSCSYAFSREGGIRKCANMHLGCRWLLKFDLQDFFTSINETKIFKVFSDLGYSALLSFELARLCTTLHLPRNQRSYLEKKSVSSFSKDETSLPYFPQPLLGVLPQGAPTSPMLSNLVAYNLDQALNAYARRLGFVYTRYADDLTLSAVDIPIKMSIGKIVFDVYKIIITNHFIPNKSKTSIQGPGSRKLVLGLLVDGDESTRVSKNMRHRIDRNLYAISKYDIAQVAEHEGFDSAYGFINHMVGLLAYIKDVDLKLYSKFETQYADSISKFRMFE
jgi:RNA-directed DNA polymerase